MPTALEVRTRTVLDVPVAVSTAVAPLLGRPATGVVVASFPAAVYVRLDGGRVLAVVASDGLRLPNALVLAASSREAPFAQVRAGDPAAVTGGALVLAGLRCRPVRAWAPRERTGGTLQADAVDALDALLSAAPPVHTGEVARRLRAATTRLGDALRGRDDLAGAADALVGLGPGLTPAGDDVLAGVLVTHVHLGHRLDALTAQVVRRAGATTALSAELLRHAGEGRAAPPVLGLLDALVGARPVRPALLALLAVGSTSGADTATGVLLAARSLDPRRVT